MKIENNILKSYLKNVLFITGTAYAGKSTMCAMLAEKFDLFHCGENYKLDEFLAIATPDKQPHLCYQRKDWKEFLNRSPEEYETWIYGSGREIAEMEIVELIRVSGNQRVIVDTNIPVVVLKEIADYQQVAVLLSPQSMSVERFFDRDDPDKVFLLHQIKKCEDPEKTMENYRECIARTNSKEHYDEYAESGFFTITREDIDQDTRNETLDLLAKHFGLE
jgi:dephospho-CoA kinase